MTNVPSNQLHCRHLADLHAIQDNWIWVNRGKDTNCKLETMDVDREPLAALASSASLVEYVDPAVASGWAIYQRR